MAYAITAEKADMTKAATIALPKSIQFDEGCDPSGDRQQGAVHHQSEETQCDERERQS